MFSEDPIVAITCLCSSSGDAAAAAPTVSPLADEDGLDDDGEVGRPQLAC